MLLFNSHNAHFDHDILTTKRSLQDVRLYAARCLSQLLRVFAPESPYDDDTLEVRYRRNTADKRHQLHVAGHGINPAAAMQEVFKLLWWCFKRLQQAQAPTFTLCLSLLQITAQVCVHQLDVQPASPPLDA